MEKKSEANGHDKNLLTTLNNNNKNLLTTLNNNNKNLLTTLKGEEKKRSEGNGIVNYKNLTSLTDYGDEIQNEWNDNDKDLISLLDKYGPGGGGGNGGDKNNVAAVKAFAEDKKGEWEGNSKNNVATLKAFAEDKKGEWNKNNNNVATVKGYGEDNKSQWNGNDKNVATPTVYGEGKKSEWSGNNKNVVNVYGDNKNSEWNSNNKNVAPLKAYGEDKKTEWNGNNKNSLTLKTYSYAEAKPTEGYANYYQNLTALGPKQSDTSGTPDKTPTTLKTSSTADEKTNDSITLAKVWEAVKEIKNEVDEMKQKMAMEPDVNAKLVSLEKAMNIINYPPGPKNKMALRYYPRYGLQFVGFGFPENDQVKSEKVFSLENCLQMCAEHRDKNGLKWNGLWYRVRDRYCSCGSKVKGFNVNVDYLFYRFN